MSATPVIVWVTSGTRSKLDRIAYQRGTCREEVGGDLLTEALRNVKTNAPPVSERDGRYGISDAAA